MSAMASREERRLKREEKIETVEEEEKEEEEMKKKKKKVKKTASQIWSNYAEVIGPSKPLPTSDLPTLRDVLQQVLLLKESKDSRTPTSSILEEVAVMVKEIWARANVRLIDSDARISDKAVFAKIRENWQCVVAQMDKRRGKKKNRGGAGEPFSERLDKLFPILHCHCPFISCAEAKCESADCDAVHIFCTCPKAKKV